MNSADPSKFSGTGEQAAEKAAQETAGSNGVPGSEENNASAPSELGSVQGRAARALLSNLVNETELSEIQLHQAATLKELTTLKNGLTALNKKSADEYTLRAAEFMRAVRAANQVKTDLNDISRRLRILRRKIEILTPEQPAPE